MIRLTKKQVESFQCMNASGDLQPQSIVAQGLYLIGRGVQIDGSNLSYRDKHGEVAYRLALKDLAVKKRLYGETENMVFQRLVAACKLLEIGEISVTLDGIPVNVTASSSAKRIYNYWGRKKRDAFLAEASRQIRLHGKTY